MNEAFMEAQEASGIDFGARDPRLRVLDDKYGHESSQFTIYWRGPHSAAGSRAGLRLDITNEVVVFDPVLQRVAHPFSDADGLGDLQLRCYTLDEIMAEKVRAVLGQRIYAISRDIYDIFALMEYVDERRVLAGLPRKMAARDVDAEAVDLRRMTERRDEFRADWGRNLAGLLAPGAEQQFDEVWESVVDYVGRMAEGLDWNRRDAQ